MPLESRQERYLLVSTPRSGNTWLRRMLAGCLGLTEYGVHRPSDFDWSAAGERFIVQLHWRLETHFTNLMQAHGIAPVTICRHPLDVLISILHFSRYEPQTAQWLDGEGGGESSLAGATPLSAAFEEYALSRRAKALLAVSSEWMRAGTPYVRYEDLVRCPEGSLQALLSPRRFAEEQIRAIVDSNSLAQLRPTSANYHYWQGRPGLWKELIGARLADRIALEHSEVFQQLGYGVEDALDLKDTFVLQRWKQIAAPA